MSRDGILSAMEEMLNPDTLGILKRCGEVGDRRDTNIYVVGGFVRDILLRRPGFDIDLVVEGNGAAFSGLLADRLKGEMKVYGDFGTATIRTENGIRVDVASARREVYEAPAALPKVSVGNLKDDMFRRDFTINSMAISLNAKSFGDLVDFFSGEKDLARGVIRVLHEESFVDDPTRIMRAVRFEVRFGFRMDTKTERLLNSALSSRMLELLTPERKRYELELLFSEDKPGQACERMRELKVFKHLAAGLKCPDKRQMRRMAKSIDELGKKLRVKPWVVYLIALADTLPFGEAVSFGKSLSLKRRDIQKIIELNMAKPELKRLEAEGEMKPSTVYRILKNLSPEVLVYSHSLARTDTARDRITQFAESHRTKKTLITGNDIKTLGIEEGPIYREVLDRVLDARIDGEVSTYDEEMELARRIVEAS